MRRVLPSTFEGQVHRNIVYDRKIVSSHILLSLKVRCVSVGTRLNLFSCMSARARMHRPDRARHAHSAHGMSATACASKCAAMALWLSGTHVAAVNPVPAQIRQG